uniref:Altered inheritance of mitochondria protein 24, mitochondrial n=1 Tax=Alexandrium monilatum TaxID=311494 RepID=A0A7S4UCV8_9DINO|mmetsp:Transcript_27782/g.86655  ORF Transcript_27782/g.86655 Transcript_27782/m.86655 type:complete len:489 (+) Transcript_27782:138-1604(+)
MVAFNGSLRRACCLAALVADLSLKPGLAAADSGYGFGDRCEIADTMGKQTLPQALLQISEMDAGRPFPMHSVGEMAEADEAAPTYTDLQRQRVPRQRAPLLAAQAKPAASPASRPELADQAARARSAAGSQTGNTELLTAMSALLPAPPRAPALLAVGTTSGMTAAMVFIPAAVFCACLVFALLHAVQARASKQDEAPPARGSAPQQVPRLNVQDVTRRSQAPASVSSVTGHEGRRVHAASGPPNVAVAASLTPSPRLPAMRSSTSVSGSLVTSARASFTQALFAPPANVPCLSPELIVPADNECCLLMPRIIPRNFGATDTVTINDTGGGPVFVASICLSSGDQLARSGGRRIALQSAMADLTFCFCRDAEQAADSGLPGLDIFTAKSKLFGTLRAVSSDDSPGNFFVQTTKGVCISFRGDRDSGGMLVSAQDGRLMAMTESTSPYERSVRIGPSVDAGLISLTMLGVDLLDHDSHISARPSVISVG